MMDLLKLHELGGNRNVWLPEENTFKMTAAGGQVNREDVVQGCGVRWMRPADEQMTSQHRAEAKAKDNPD